MNSPLLIAGAQRSGTTLLCAMLNQHPEHYVANELPGVPYQFLSDDAWQAEAFFNCFPGDSRFASTPVPPQAPTCQSGWNYLEAALGDCARQFHKSQWGIKDPSLSEYLPRFAARYPNARFLIIIRDARPVVASMLTHAWYVANVFHGARVWREQVETQLQFASQHPSRCAVVIYETLVAQPRETAQKFCQALDLEFVEAMLTRPNHSDLVPNRQNENVFKPIDQGIAEKWKTQLTPRQVQVIESVAGPLMEKLGYPLVSQSRRLSPTTRLGYACHQKLVSECKWQWTRRIAPVLARVRKSSPG